MTASELVERLGRGATRGVEEVGLAASLLAESVYWLFMGPRRGQPVRMPSVAEQMMQIGVLAIPIVSVLAGTIGAMLAIQGIDTLETFGAES